MNQADREARERLIVQAVQAFAGSDKLHQACFAKWFYEQGAPEAKAQAAISMAVARWAGYEPGIVLEIVYNLLEEINYHPELRTLKAAVEAAQ